MKYDLKAKIKEFKPTSWSIDNKTSIYVLAIIISIFGIFSYNSIPKEQFPEIVIPTILVNTVYSGTSPTDMENLVTRPLEKNIKSINGVKKITSTSMQDISSIVVEFNPNIDVAEAKQKVKDKVDNTSKDLPNDLTITPNVTEIDFSEIPIMYINISGDYNLEKLKKFAEIAQDKIEALKEITRVDIIGALDREIQINVDMFKMQAASITTTDIYNAVRYENVTISGGAIDMQGMGRTIRVVGEFKDIETIKNIVMKSSSGATVKLSDIAEIKDYYHEQESFARLDKKNVITLNVIKKSGQNLLEASDKIKEIITDLKKDKFPSNVNVTLTGDQSKFTRNTLTELNNTIIIGFILVTIILMFFMGMTNALFVGLSVPLSMAIAYIFMPWIGFTMNMLVMFSFIFALGIVVDDAIVVIENIHRIFKQNKGRLDITQSAKNAAGEVFIPILSGTLTTLAPFVPLAFWPGIVGKFMFYIPITLIITLFASLIVAYIINPVFAVSFMNHEEEDNQRDKKRILKIGGIIAGVGILCYIPLWVGIANFILFIAFSFVMHNLYGYKLILRFQHRTLPKLLTKYENLINWVLFKKRPYVILWGMVGLFIVTVVLTALVKPRVVFFPDNEPNNIAVYIKMPVGTDVKVTDSITKTVEGRVYNVLGKNNPIVESVISNVALGASESIFDKTATSNKSKITVNFIEYNKRHGLSTSKYLDEIREVVKDIPNAVISVEKNRMGPPTGKPINIEISGDDLDELISTSNAFIKYIDSLNIPGIEELKSDFANNKPELIINIDRERANREGIFTGQIGVELRTAILGKELSKYRDGEDQFPIQLRYQENQRKNINTLLNLKITYRDMNSGLLRQIPLSSLAKIEYINSYGGINRKNLKRVITISSNVLSGYNANEIVQRINASLPAFQKSDKIDISLTGEQEDQKESMGFLSKALLLSLCMIFFILITQFNSMSKPIIIISEVFFSIIGVLLGFIIFGMPISIIMTGLGVVALAGIVVRNGILLVEFTDVLKAKGLKTRDAIIQAGKTRITPVLLTASATILGLVPLAIGFNIDFITLFTNLNPHIHFGGENMLFFGPLAWTIIFGLSFATFLTLILIPIMYFIMYVGKTKVQRGINKRKIQKPELS
jgi:multidrug efflux pump